MCGGGSRGTMVCGNYVGMGVAIFLIVIGKILFITGFFMLIGVGVADCYYTNPFNGFTYYLDVCTDLWIIGGTCTGVGGVLLAVGFIVYYQIRKHPVRNPNAVIRISPAPGTYPAAAYPPNVYQYPALGAYPGQSLPTANYSQGLGGSVTHQYYPPAQGSVVITQSNPPIEGGLVITQSIPQDQGDIVNPQYYPQALGEPAPPYSEYPVLVHTEIKSQPLAEPENPQF